MDTRKYIEELTDEEIDEQFKERKSNQKKSIAPAIAYLIIKDNTDEKHHMTQAELAKRLAKSPIDIEMDRKSISRMVYTLADAGIGISAAPRKGVWYDGNIWYDSDTYL